MHSSDLLTSHFRLSASQQSALRKLRLKTVSDLLYHLPQRYENIEDIKSIESVTPGDTTVVYGQLSGLKTRKAWKRRIPMSEGFVTDGTGKLKVMWFNQPYIPKMYPEGAFVKLSGKVTGKGDKTYLANPEIERVEAIPSMGDALFRKSEGLADQTLFAMYPESKGITSKWMRHAFEKIAKSGLFDELDDPLPKEVRERYHLPELRTALLWIHTPKQLKDAEAARKRFAFQEVFIIQIAKRMERKQHEQQPSFTISPSPAAIDDFMSAFPFEPTRAQKKAIADIFTDFKTGRPMARLLEGDVGSGKTAVAATTAYAVVTTRPSGKDYGALQVAYMAPTEILAKQHFESFIAYFGHRGVSVGLITSAGCKKFPSKVNPGQATDISRTQLLKWVANGEIPILVGTHALIQKTVKFKNLAYVIIDEQHRFGTAQRHLLTRKDRVVPHLLSMTATPIPRTLALTLYGDLDLTLLDEMPAGRKPILTEIVSQSSRAGAYEKIRGELAAGRQAYVICPRIDEPDPEKQMALYAKSVKAEAKRLQKEVFPEYEIGVLHSKLKPRDKDDVMARFVNAQIDILTSTSVVEVGVNVPNATVIVIEGAERFGLAQLHQLRGRVLRSNHQAHCFVFSDSRGKMTTDRLRALKTAKNGFELAEYDLALRGPGELYGRKQSGLSDLGMEALKNLKLVEAARKEAHEMVGQNTLSRYPALTTLVAQKTRELHFE